MEFAANMKLGKLTLIRFAGRDKHSKRQWLCKCECGTMVMRTEGNLNATKVPHCGCSPGWKGHNKRFVDLSGQRFGKLTVIDYSGKDKYSHNKWLCVCDCGKEIITETNSLKSGKTKSCGCLAREMLLEKNITHNKTHSRLYRIYNHIKDRCYRKNDVAYANYGGRGIRMCLKWKNSFEAFYDWAITYGYKETLTIERIDVNKGYSPDNCKWIPQVEQSYNKRNSLILEYNGESKTLIEWVKILNLDYHKMYYRIITRKMSVKTAFEK